MLYGENVCETNPEMVGGGGKQRITNSIDTKVKNHILNSQRKYEIETGIYFFQVTP